MVRIARLVAVAVTCSMSVILVSGAEELTSSPNDEGPFEGGVFARPAGQPYIPPPGTELRVPHPSIL